jgi:hypothetical protein
MARATSSNQPQSIVCSPPVYRKVSVTPSESSSAKSRLTRVSRPGEDSTLGRMGGGRQSGSTVLFGFASAMQWLMMDRGPWLADSSVPQAIEFRPTGRAAPRTPSPARASLGYLQGIGILESTKLRSDSICDVTAEQTTNVAEDHDDVPLASI